MGSELIPPEEIRRIARHKRQRRLQKLMGLVRGIWKGRG